MDNGHPFNENYRAHDGEGDEAVADNISATVATPAAAPPTNPFGAAIAQRHQQQQHQPNASTDVEAGRHPPQQRRGLGGGRRPASSRSRMWDDERMPTTTTAPRRVSRPPSLEPPASALSPSTTTSSNSSSSLVEPSSLVVPQNISTSRWSRFFGRGGHNTTAATTTTTTTGTSAASTSTASSSRSSTSRSSEGDHGSTSTGTGTTNSSNTVNNDDGGKQPLKQSTHRQTKRRWRFRQGMRQAGINLGILEEGDEQETERTSRVTHEEQFDEDFSVRRCLTCNHCKSCWRSGWWQMVLVVMLCLIVVLIVVAVIIYAVGGWSFLTPATDSTSKEGDAGVASAPTDWSWDPNVLEGPTRPVRELLPRFTIWAMDQEQDPLQSSPQSQAVAWVEGHPREVANELENWKKVQLVALASFYYAFNGDQWPAEKQQAWLSYDVDECEWGDPGVEGQYFGVSCHEPSSNATTRLDDNRAGRFRALNLDWFLGFGLVGFPDSVNGNRMPPEIVFLEHLESLGLMNSGLSAVLTNLLPPTLSQLPSLSRLSYRYNRIEGTIPPLIGALTKLEYLSLGSNYVTGNLPPELGALTNLKELFLYSNELEGSMPTEIARLTNLREFSAISCELTGTIPAAVANWDLLEYFFVDHNSMTGSVPDGICQLPNMTSILVPCTVDCGSDCGELCECF